MWEVPLFLLLLLLFGGGREQSYEFLLNMCKSYCVSALINLHMEELKIKNLYSSDISITSIYSYIIYKLYIYYILYKKK